jgi:hypothetical protein
LNQNSDYSVTLAGTSGGSVTTVQAYATGYLVTVKRIVDLTQPTSIRNQGAFFPEIHENVFDRLTMIDQQQQEQLDRSLKFQNAPSASMTIPTPTPNAALAWDATGSSLINVPALTPSAEALQANLAATAPGQGAEMVGYKAPFTGAAARTQSEKNSDILGIKDFPVALDATQATSGTDNAAAVASLLTAEATRATTYGLTSSFTNKWGNPIDYPIVNMGSHLLNARLDRTNLVFGQEYLSPWFKHFKFDSELGNHASDAGPFYITICGDSTVYGVNSTDPMFTPAALIARNARNKGYRMVQVIDRSLSGWDTHNWNIDSTVPNPSYVMGVGKRVWWDDIATNPHLLVIRYGVNDLAYSNGASQFLDDMRSALTKIRATDGWSGLPIVLCTPCSTSDPANTRTEVFHEMINLGIRQLARDFKCCFVDTYGALSDSYNGSYYMDSGPGHVHPGDELYMSITKLLCDVIFPDGLGTTQINNVYNMGTDVRTLAPGADPSYLFQGVSFDRQNPGPNLGDPYNGFLFSFKTYELGSLSFSTGLPGITPSTGIAARVGKGTTVTQWLGAQTDGSAWIHAGVTGTNVFLQTSLDGRAFLEGYVQPAVYVGDLIALNIPAPYRPLRRATGICGTGAADAICRYSVETNGDVHIYELTAPKTWAILNGISYKMA